MQRCKQSLQIMRGPIQGDALILNGRFADIEGHKHRCCALGDVTKVADEPPYPDQEGDEKYAQATIEPRLR
jgi:hypothetical protein